MDSAEELLQKKLVKLVEEYFPKGEPTRGRATVMMSRFYIDVVKTIDALKELWQTKSHHQ